MLKKRRPNMVSQESDLFDQVLASSQGGLGNAELIQRLGIEQVSNSANEKLPYRSFLEQIFSEDLSDVSVSLGGDEAVEALNLEQAKAAAFVNTIVFEDQNPSLELVAHEVVHILQQRNSGQDGGEEEADAGARAALARRSFKVRGGASKKPAFKKKKVSDVRAYNTKKQGQTRSEKMEKHRQKKRAENAPGLLLGANTGGDKKKQIRALIESWDTERTDASKSKDIGFHQNQEGEWKTVDVVHPKGKQWDPYQYQPKFVFPKDECALPVRPDFDNTGSQKDDAAQYERGQIGDNQALTGAFTVARKGKYIVLNYSFYMVDNRFYKNYHKGDSATAAVYLSETKKGNWKPKFLCTSWHYGARMTPWSKLKKKNKRPIIQVERGSHALHVFGKKDKVREQGLSIDGYGKASKNGRPIDDQQLTWLSLQSNMKNTEDMSDDEVAVNKYFKNYPERRSPAHPGVFKKRGLNRK